MRDSGFEFEYQGELYFAKEGFLEPFHKSVRGNYLVSRLQKHNLIFKNMAKPTKYWYITQVYCCVLCGKETKYKSRTQDETKKVFRLYDDLCWELKF
jgi:hypothetical protein